MPNPAERIPSSKESEEERETLKEMMDGAKNPEKTRAMLLKMMDMAIEITRKNGTPKEVEDMIRDRNEIELMPPEEVLEKYNEVLAEEKEREAELAKKDIKDASTFEELFDILDVKKEVNGHSAEKLTRNIKIVMGAVGHMIRDKDIGGLKNILEGGDIRAIATITRTDGLRDKVIELIKESIEPLVRTSNQ